MEIVTLSLTVSILLLTVFLYFNQTKKYNFLSSELANLKLEFSEYKKFNLAENDKIKSGSNTLYENQKEILIVLGRIKSQINKYNSKKVISRQIKKINQEDINEELE